MFRVYKQRCAECLFSKNKIVSDRCRKEILAGCHKDGNYFICHKATLQRQQVCCKGFFDTQDTQIIQIAKRLGVVEEVDLPEEDCNRLQQGEEQQ